MNSDLAAWFFLSNLLHLSLSQLPSSETWGHPGQSFPAVWLKQVRSNKQTNNTWWCPYVTCASHPFRKRSSPSGNRTPIFQVTGGDTVRYTSVETSGRTELKLVIFNQPTEIRRVLFFFLNKNRSLIEGLWRIFFETRHLRVRENLIDLRFILEALLVHR